MSLIVLSACGNGATDLDQTSREANLNQTEGAESQLLTSQSIGYPLNRTETTTSSTQSSESTQPSLGSATETAQEVVVNPEEEITQQSTETLGSEEVAVTGVEVSPDSEESISKEEFTQQSTETPASEEVAVTGVEATPDSEESTPEEEITQQSTETPASEEVAVTGVEATPDSEESTPEEEITQQSTETPAGEEVAVTGVEVTPDSEESTPEEEITQQSTETPAGEEVAVTGVEVTPDSEESTPEEEITQQSTETPAGEEVAVTGVEVTPDTEESTQPDAPSQPAVEVASSETSTQQPSQQSTQTVPVIGAANSANNLAFPGALGWAADTTTGGRGGIVVTVDSLSNAVDPNDGITTFREALSEINEPRIIVFSVAGLIDYRSGPSVPASTILLNDSDSDVTIACQTAPPPGVTLMGDGVKFSGSTNNVIIRHCRFRNSDPVSVGSAENSSCIRATASPSTTGQIQRNFVIDHVSCMWAADDPVAFAIPKIAGEIGGNMENISISNSIVSEGDADSLHEESGQIPQRYLHAMGPGCASAATTRTIDRCSMARNIMAHNGRRNPKVWGVVGLEVVNNIIYNPNEVGISAKGRLVKTIDGFLSGNLIQLGPTSKATAKPIDLVGNTVSSSRLEISGNFLGEFGSSVLEPYNNPPSSNSNVPTTVPVTPILDILDMSREGSDHLRCVGASRPRRDTHDQRVIDEFHQQAGQVGILGNHERDFSEYSPEPIAQNWIDSDRDGMPDSWEVKMGVTDADQFDLSFDYTNIEVYLNGLALCPSISFESETLSFPAGTIEAQIPFDTTWETWAGGQTFEVCVESFCELFDDPTNSDTVTVSVPGDGVFRVSMTPVGADGVRETIFGSINLLIGQ